MDRVMLQYLPPVLREYREYICLMESYQTAFAALWALEEEMEGDLFLATASEAGLAHWDALLGVESEGEPERRRQQLFSKLAQGTPYSRAAFFSFLNAIAGGADAFVITLSGLTLDIRIQPAFRGLYDQVLELVRTVVPANIAWTVTPVYTSFGQLQGLRHGELRPYTHEQLYSEVNLF